MNESSDTLGPETFLIDTHCHIHDAAFNERFKGMSSDEMIAAARAAGVKRFICVGTDVSSSRQALEFCAKRPGCFASIALHPHEAEKLDEAGKLCNKTVNDIPEGVRRHAGKACALRLREGERRDSRSLSTRRSTCIRHSASTGRSIRQ